MGKSRRKSLGPDDWIHAVFEALAADGPAGVRIERLARRLGVTPGSFYWHFKNRDELRDRALQFWRDEMLRRAAAAAQAVGPGPEKIRALPDILVARGLPDYDAAIRVWATGDPVVAEAVVRADDLRIRMLTDLLKAAGLDTTRASERAKLLMWAFRGSGGVGQEERLATFRDAIEALLSDAGPQGTG